MPSNREQPSKIEGYLASMQWLDFQLVVENFNWLSLKVVKVGNGLKVIS